MRGWDQDSQELEEASMEKKGITKTWGTKVGDQVRYRDDDGLANRGLTGVVKAWGTDEDLVVEIGVGGGIKYPDAGQLQTLNGDPVVMPAKPLNARLGERVYAWLRKHPDHHRQSQWFEPGPLWDGKLSDLKPECGTRMCLAGAICATSRTPRVKVALTGFLIVDGERGGDWAYEAWQLLGGDMAALYPIFMTVGSNELALERFRTYLDSGGTEN